MQVLGLLVRTFKDIICDADSSFTRSLPFPRPFPYLL